MITEIIEELEIKIFEMSEFKHQRSVESEKNQVNNNSQEITNYLKSKRTPYKQFRHNALV